MGTGLTRVGPLDQQHREHGAHMAVCSNIAMPMWYSGRGAIFEAHAARESVGLFDCSHLTRLFVTGRGANASLRHALTYDVNTIAVEDSHEALFCSENGGVLDKIRVHHLGDVRWLLVPDALQTGSESIPTYIRSNPVEEVRVDDRTDNTAMLALQGPMAVELLGELLTPAIANRIPSWRSTEIELYGHKALLWRTGAPQGDGFQIVCSVDAARHLWHLLIAAGATPCGLDSREILRQERGEAAVGHELDGDADPYETGLESLVSLNGSAFRGSEALMQRCRAPGRTLACLTATGRGAIFRQGFPVLHGMLQVARLTSGGFSPMLGRSIGIALVPLGLAQFGTKLAIEVRGRTIAAIVSPAPIS